MLLEAEEITHLPWHRHRRQQRDLGTRHDGLIDPGADRPIEKPACVIERALAAVDESKHGAKVLCGPVAVLRGKPKVDDRPVAIYQRPNASAAICLIEGDEPHGAISFPPLTAPNDAVSVVRVLSETDAILSTKAGAIAKHAFN